MSCSTQDMVDNLRGWCPDYQGLLINLYEPVREAWQRGELAQQRSPGAGSDGA